MFIVLFICVCEQYFLQETVVMEMSYVSDIRTGIVPKVSI